jgi:hypothetical protein
MENQSTEKLSKKAPQCPGPRPFAMREKLQKGLLLSPGGPGGEALLKWQSLMKMPDPLLEPQPVNYQHPMENPNVSGSGTEIKVGLF